MSRKILVICPKFPYPPNDGSKLANCSLLDCLSNLEFETDLICYTKEYISPKRISEFKERYNLSRILIFKRAADPFKLSRIINAIYSILNSKSLPFTYIPFKLSKSEAKELKQFNSDWKHIIFDGLHSCVGFLEQKLLKATPDSSIIYRAHNCESELWYQTGANFGFFLRSLINNQALRVKRFESELIKQVDKLWTLSKKDLNNLLELQHTKNAEIIPVAFDFTNTSKQLHQNDQINLLFIGDLNWTPNSQGIQWFLKNVWRPASAANNNLWLHIVGKNSRKLLRDYLSWDRIQIHDYVENLDQIYDTSDCCIIPIFTGSGVRIKAIEAASKKLAIISTELGISGLALKDNESYLKANNSNEWIETLQRLTKPLCKRVGDNGHSELKSNMSKEVVIKRIADALIQI